MRRLPDIIKIYLFYADGKIYLLLGPGLAAKAESPSTSTCGRPRRSSASACHDARRIPEEVQRSRLDSVPLPRCATPPVRTGQRLTLKHRGGRPYLHASASALGLIEGFSDAAASLANFAGGTVSDDPGRRRRVDHDGGALGGDRGCRRSLAGGDLARWDLHHRVLDGCGSLQAAESQPAIPDRQ
jgi:hypothetical protein